MVVVIMVGTLLRHVLSATLATSENDHGLYLCNVGKMEINHI
jgi:hypothetical protein